MPFRSSAGIVITTRLHHNRQHSFDTQDTRILSLPSTLYQSIFSHHYTKRVVLGTGRLTIARAIGHFFLGGGGGGGKMNLENFQRKKKKRILSRLEPINSPVQLPLAHRDTAEEVGLNHFFMIQLFLLLALTSPNPSQVLALALTITRAPRHRSRISFNIQLILAFPVS